MELNSSSMIRLHHLLIRQGSAGTYYVSKLGGRSQIATRGAGVAAIYAFKQRHSLGEIEQTLAVSSRSVSLRPLVEALLSSNLVRSVDGIRVSRPDFHPINFIKSVVRHYVLPACFKLMKQLPIYPHRLSLYVVSCLNSYGSLQQRARTADTNIRTTPMPVPRHFRRKYLHNLLLNIADTDALFAATPDEAMRWLDKATVWQGFDNIKLAQSLGKGLIVAGFHLSATRLIAPLLLSRGLNVHVTATPSPSVDITETIRWHRDLRSRLYHVGQFDQIPQIQPSTLSTLLEVLTRNDVVLTFPDMHTISIGSDDATKKRCAFFGLASTIFKPPAITVDVAGVSARMNEWVGWLAAQSGSPVVPLALVRVKSGNFVMNISPPIICHGLQDSKERGRAINRELFSVLDGYVRSYPSQWFGWHRFHLQRVTA